MKKLMFCAMSMACIYAPNAFCARYRFSNKTKYDLRVKIDVAYGLDKEISIRSQEHEEIDTGTLHMARGYTVYAAVENREEEVLKVDKSRFSSVSCTIFTENTESPHNPEAKRIKFYGTESEVLDGADLFVERCSVRKKK